MMVELENCNRDHMARTNSTIYHMVLYRQHRWHPGFEHGLAHSRWLMHRVLCFFLDLPISFPFQGRPLRLSLPAPIDSYRTSHLCWALGLPQQELLEISPGGSSLNLALGKQVGPTHLATLCKDWSGFKHHSHLLHCAFNSSWRLSHFLISGGNS